MSVRYKFKNDLNYATIPIDEFHISVLDFKRAVIQHKKMGRQTDFDLDVMNAQNNVMLIDETAMITKNSTLLLIRKPLPKGQHKIWEVGDPMLNNGNGSENNTAVSMNGNMELTTKDGVVLSEEDRLEAAIAASNEMYDRRNWLKVHNTVKGGVPHQNYVCFKCNIPGHFYHDCPNVVGVKKATGIPRTFLIPAERDTPGAKINATGQFMANEMETVAYKTKKIDVPVWSDDTSNKESMEKKILEIPDELRCGYCKDLLKDCVMMPECACSICDHCAGKALLESDTNSCPICGEPNNCPEDLIPCRNIREKVGAFLIKQQKHNNEDDGKMETIVKDVPPPPHSTVVSSKPANKFQQIHIPNLLPIGANPSVMESLIADAQRKQQEAEEAKERKLKEQQEEKEKEDAEKRIKRNLEKDSKKTSENKENVEEPNQSSGFATPTQDETTNDISPVGKVVKDDDDEMSGDKKFNQDGNESKTTVSTTIVSNGTHSHHNTSQQSFNTPPPFIYQSGGLSHTAAAPQFVTPLPTISSSMMIPSHVSLPAVSSVSNLAIHQAPSVLGRPLSAAVHPHHIGHLPPLPHLASHNMVTDVHPPGTSTHSFIDDPLAAFEAAMARKEERDHMIRVGGIGQHHHHHLTLAPPPPPTIHSHPPPSSSYYGERAPYLSTTSSSTSHYPPHFHSRGGGLYNHHHHSREERRHHHDTQHRQSSVGSSSTSRQSHRHTSPYRDHHRHHSRGRSSISPSRRGGGGENSKHGKGRRSSSNRHHRSTKSRSRSPKHHRSSTASTSDRHSKDSIRVSSSSSTLGERRGGHVDKVTKEKVSKTKDNEKEVDLRATLSSRKRRKAAEIDQGEKMEKDDQRTTVVVGEKKREGNVHSSIDKEDEEEGEKKQSTDRYDKSNSSNSSSSSLSKRRRMSKSPSQKVSSHPPTPTTSPPSSHPSCEEASSVTKKRVRKEKKKDKDRKKDKKEKKKKKKDRNEEEKEKVAVSESGETIKHESHLTTDECEDKRHDVISSPSTILRNNSPSDEGVDEKETNCEASPQSSPPQPTSTLPHSEDEDEVGLGVVGDSISLMIDHTSIFDDEGLDEEDKDGVNKSEEEEEDGELEEGEDDEKEMEIEMNESGNLITTQSDEESEEEGGDVEEKMVSKWDNSPSSKRHHKKSKKSHKRSKKEEYYKKMKKQFKHYLKLLKEKESELAALENTEVTTTSSSPAKKVGGSKKSYSIESESSKATMEGVCVEDLERGVDSSHHLLQVTLHRKGGGDGSDEEVRRKGGIRKMNRHDDAFKKGDSSSNNKEKIGRETESEDGLTLPHLRAISRRKVSVKDRLGPKPDSSFLDQQNEIVVKHLGDDKEKERGKDDVSLPPSSSITPFTNGCRRVDRNVQSRVRIVSNNGSLHSNDGVRDKVRRNRSQSEEEEKEELAEKRRRREKETRISKNGLISHSSGGGRRKIVGVNDMKLTKDKLTSDAAASSSLSTRSHRRRHRK